MKTLFDEKTLEECSNQFPSFLEELGNDVRKEILSKMIFTSYEKGKSFSKKEKSPILYISFVKETSNLPPMIQMEENK